MAGRIRDEDIALVRDSSALVDVLTEYGVQVKRAGTSYKALCPFHDEKSPSLSLRPDTGLWHCFGCDEGGDVIDFVQKIDNLNFLEAVERLAERKHIELRREDDNHPTPEPSGPRRHRILEINKFAEQWFASRLATDPEAAPARTFLHERAFTREHADQFTLGYAPQGWDNLSAYLTSQRVNADEIIGAGLASLSKRGTCVDRFRGRLIWPIHDITGSTIGFGARKLYDTDDGPKYLNTPETGAYKKSQVLYGLDLARKEIARNGHAVIVEGYTDVMAAHVSGITTAVATCGTAFGEDHTRILRRVLSDSLTTETTFTFDGDGAGQKAALRAYELDAKFQSSTSVAIVPDGLDPCELRLRDGDSALRDLIAARTPLFEFVIKTAIAGQDLASPSGRTTAMALAAPVLARIKDGFLRAEHERTLASRLGVDDKSLHDAVAVAARTPQPGARTRPTTARADTLSLPALTPTAGAAVNTVSVNPNAVNTVGVNPAGVSAVAQDDSAEEPPHPDEPPPPDDIGADNNQTEGFHHPRPNPAPANPSTGPVPYPRPDPAAANLWTERELARLTLQQPHLVGVHLPALTGAELSHPAYRDIARLARLAGTATTPREHWIAFIRDHATNPTTSALIIELSVEPLQTVKPNTEYVKFIIIRSQLLALERAFATVQTQLRQADPDDEQARTDLMGRKRDNNRERNLLNIQLSAINYWAET